MTERHSRREFIGLTSAATAGIIAGSSPGGSLAGAAPPDARDPDLVVFNANVYTVDAGVPRAEAFAVKDGRFSAVGTTADIKGLISKTTQSFDAKQMTVVPGFIDCHNHAGGDVLLYEVLVGNPFQ